ncbi:hypothetical protein [Zooshikella harenae]|uniref:Uncharacterized protein n=1 Tax=Zooshikella harenae TaxID=2827238 RepID=A0ABS5ZJ81_9GAMM|nr:hypothetical protein [Zooshikella harenae]MBU2713990.1 hypothetical protein [Zooshikella harenae]
MEESVWVDFFDKGVIDEKKIKESIERNKYYQDINTENWVKLWHYHNLTDLEFEELLAVVGQELIEYKYTNHQVVKHLAGLFIRFSDIAFISENKTSILDTFKNYVNYLFDNDHLPSELNGCIFDFDNESWGGLGFAGRDISEFDQFVKYLDEKIEEYKVKCLPNAAKELLEIMESDVMLFTRKLILCNDGENIYYQTPILKNIEPEEFVTKLLSLSGQNFRQVGYMFKKRYSYREFHSNLIYELDWLKQVETLLEQKRSDAIGKLSGYRIGLFVDGYLKTAIDALEQGSKQSI